MSDITATKNDVLVRSCPSPFLSRKIDFVFKEGRTVQEILESIDISDNVSILVTIEGVPVRPEDYANVIPSSGACVTVRAIPTGGGGDKNIFRLVLTVVVVVVAYVYGGPMGGAAATSLFGAGAAGIGAALGTMAVMTVGMLIVNAIAPPATAELGQISGVGGLSSLGAFSGGSVSGGSGASAKPSYALSGANNSLIPYGPIPMLLGRHRISPPYGARPYTTNEGDDQYLHCLFCEGNGLIFMIDHRFGETPVENYSDVEMEVFNGDVSTNSTIFPGDVYQQDESIVLVQSEGWAVRETQPNTNRISVDITYPNGLIKLNDDGSTTRVDGLVDIQYRKKGDVDWIGETHTVTW
ncbi:MAG: hypothetical protein KJ630_19130 [Proteobacteria bacterium]|nr:hypothetical protein [Pseudomonadota bacterium]